jgi:two-component sensor histidine kinase
MANELPRSSTTLSSTEMTNAPKQPSTRQRFADDDEGFEASRARLQALTWIRQTLSDVDSAMEAGKNSLAKELLRRVQRVLEMPDIQTDPDDDDERG